MLWTGRTLAAIVGIAGTIFYLRNRYAGRHRSPRRRLGARQLPRIRGVATRLGVWVVIATLPLGIATLLLASLTATHHAAFFPVALAAVVGATFWIFPGFVERIALRVIGVLTCMIAAVGLVVGLTTAIAPSAVVYPAVGTLLAGYGLALLSPLWQAAAAQGSHS